jgi:peptidoglycan/LPS O-acetylase OafA/YrhL
MTFIGTISYPLYLWHWPLITSNKLFSGAKPTILSGFLIILTSIALAYLTTLLIEKPIRKP